MKKILLLTLTLSFILIGSVGCVKRDSMEDISIITSSYPIEYLVNEMYGEHAEVENIFPDGEEIGSYRFNEKQFNNFSKEDLFIYNGENASDIALKLINKNDNLLLIDSSLGMKYTYGVEEFWLDPSNLLMMSLNIKNGLEEYISNTVLIKEINDSYQDLNVSLSELDADIKHAVSQANNPKIVVSNKSLVFLEKYGMEVIVLDENTIDKTYEEVKVLISTGEIKYIYNFKEDVFSDKLNSLIKNTGIKTNTLFRLDSITDEQRNNDEDYISIMKDNLELLKQEIYK